MNRSKDLRKLFRESLINARKHRETPMYNGNANGGYNFVNYLNGENVRIYFYEWSDLNKAPRVFYQMKYFESFLTMCGIKLELFQKDIIRNLGTAYITCHSGTKNLSIRYSYKSLRDSLTESDTKSLVPKASGFGKEVDGRWPQNDGTFFG